MYTLKLEQGDEYICTESKEEVIRRALRDYPLSRLHSLPDPWLYDSTTNKARFYMDIVSAEYSHCTSYRYHMVYVEDPHPRVIYLESEQVVPAKFK